MDFVCVRYWFRFDDTRFDLFGLKLLNVEMNVQK